MRSIFVFPPVLLAGLFSSPAYAAKFDPKSVHKVAVVAFGGDLALNPTATSSGMGAMDSFNAVKGAVDAANDAASGEAQKRACDNAIQAHTTVEAGLVSGLGWEILPQDQLLANAAFTGARDALLERLHAGERAETWCLGMKPPQILGSTTALYLKMEERDALIDALGVEALVVPSLEITGEDSGVSVGGIGTSRVKPTTTVWVSIYTKGEKKPVFKGYATGKKTEEAIKADFGVGAEDAQSWPIIHQSIELGVAKFGEKYGAAAE